MHNHKLTQSFTGICLFFFLTVSLYSQETFIKVDVTQLDISGYNADDVFIDGRRLSKSQSGMITIPNKNLPTLLIVTVRGKRKFIPVKYLWVEERDIKVQGPVQNVSLAEGTNSELQSISDKILKNNKPNLKTQAQLAFSKPYLVNINRTRDFLKNSYLEQLVASAPENIYDFWAYRSLIKFLDDQKKVGFDPETNMFSHLTALNKSQEEQEVRLKGDKPILIDFSSSSCRPCLADIPKMVAIREEYGDSLEMLTMWDDANYNTWTKVSAKLKSLITWNSLWDKSGVVYQRFDIKVLPTYMLFDKSGKLLKKWHKPPKNLAKYL